MNYGTSAGSLNQTADGSTNNVVYTYTYGPGTSQLGDLNQAWTHLNRISRRAATAAAAAAADAGDNAYCSPILHHVPLPGLLSATTYFYAVGELRGGRGGAATRLPCVPALPPLLPMPMPMPMHYTTGCDPCVRLKATLRTVSAR